jgi:hypothetical protein
MQLFPILLAAFSLLFLWALWLRHQLNQKLRRLENKEKLLRQDLSKRRDIVPYLLESARMHNETDDSWFKLMESRKQFHKVGQSKLTDEWKFEEKLRQFLSEQQVKNVSYLEAKKDISLLSDRIETTKGQWTLALNSYNQVRNQFPYSLASAIFGYPEIHIEGLT